MLTCLHYVLPSLPYIFIALKQLFPNYVYFLTLLKCQNASLLHYVLHIEQCLRNMVDLLTSLS